MTRSLTPMQPSVGNKGQFLVEEPQAAAASCTYKRSKEHKQTSAPYKLAIAHMQAAGEWRSWLAPHVRVHRYTRVCTTRQCDDRLGIYLYIYIYARRGQPCVPRHKPRVGVGSRDLSPPSSPSSFTFIVHARAFTFTFTFNCSQLSHETFDASAAIMETEVLITNFI